MSSTTDHMMDESKNGYFSQAWLVLLLTVFTGAALAAVQINFSEKIAANKLNETLEKIPELAPPARRAADSGKNGAGLDIDAGTFTHDADGKIIQYTVFRVAQKDQAAGWVVKAAGQGYADRIELLVGLAPDLSTITGIYILEQKETPGLGNKIIYPEWRNQFTGKSTEKPLQVAKGTKPSPETIDAVTGATISSRSVARIVNKTVADIYGRLNAKTFRKN